MNTIKKILDDLKLIRRIALFWVMWLTTKTYLWIFDFVGSMDKIDVETAAVVGAILAPITALQGAMAKFYQQSRKTESTNGS